MMSAPQLSESWRHASTQGVVCGIASERMHDKSTHCCCCERCGVADGGDVAPDGDPSKVELTKEVKAAKAMASPDVVHSNYDPAQMHRQLEFIDFNEGTTHILFCAPKTTFRLFY